MKELTKHSIWHCYCILGKAEELLQGLEYPDNWMKCYEVIDKFIKGLPRKSIHSEQMKNRILKIEKNGVPRITFKNAPLGGVLTWNRKNNEKICTLYLNEQIDDINQAKACGLSYGDWQIKQFPQRDTYIYFHRNTINGSLSKDVNIRNPLVGYYPDFIFDMPGCGDPSNDHISNFKAHIEVYIYISERYADIKGEQEIEEFVMEMAKLANSIKVGKAKSVWCREWIDEFGDNHLENLIWGSRADRRTLEYSANGKITGWETIFER